MPSLGSARLHETMGFEHIGTNKEIGYKLGRWHDIAYRHLGLAEGAAPPREPIPFASFRHTPASGVALAQVG